MTTRNTTTATEVESYNYADTRKNNPTSEAAAALAAVDPAFAQDSQQTKAETQSAQQKADRLTQYVQGLANGKFRVQDVSEIEKILNGEEDPAYPRLTWRKGEGTHRARTYGNLYRQSGVRR